MSELDRLMELARGLSPEKVHVLLSVAEQMAPAVSDQGFLEKLNAGDPIDVDETTASELREALAELGTPISHEEMKRQLGLR